MKPIAKEYMTQKVKTKGVDNHQDIMAPINQVIKYYNAVMIYKDTSRFDINQLKNAYFEINRISKDQPSIIPTGIYDLIVASFISKSEDLRVSSRAESIEYMELAKNVYK